MLLLSTIRFFNRRDRRGMRRACPREKPVPSEGRGGERREKKKGIMEPQINVGGSVFLL